MLIVRPATLEDCSQLGPQLREADKHELKLSCGLEPITALALSLKNSRKVYAVIDEQEIPIAIFGVVGDYRNLGVPWMLGSKGIYKHASQFMAESKQWLEVIEQDYDLLANYVHADNKKAIRWLQWMGFKMLRLVPDYGQGKAPFYEFVKVKQNV